MNKTFAAVAITSALLLAGCNGNTESTEVENEIKVPSNVRDVSNINAGWAFKMAYENDDALASGFDDSEWEEVNLPHSVDADRITNYDPTDPPFKGVSTYRKHLNFKHVNDKRQYLEFDGAAMISQIFVNGKFAGEHVGGFSRFRVDITDFLIDGENAIAIQIDNRSYTPGVHDTAFLPMETGQDWIYYGGLYRDVKLLEVSSVSIDAEDYGSSGVYFLQKETTDNTSEIYSNIRIRNKKDSDFSGHVRTVIKDAADKIIYSQLSPVNAESNTVMSVENEFTLSDIHLWDGIKDPYLYQVFVQVLDGEQNIIDQVEQPLGLRYFSFDADKGFLLNGEEYTLRGVAMHQDRDVVGWSTTKEMREADLETIREMGGNSVRFSLYPHNIDTAEYSNKIGFLNYIELPIANSYLNETDHGEAGAQYLESAKEQMRELVRQNFNYPSMGVVGNSNEVGLDPEPDNEAKTAWLQSLSDVIKEEFGERFGEEVPYRKTTLATVSTDVIGDPDWDTVEMPCHNVYLGWYNSTISSAPSFMDSMKAAYPDIPFCLSEYGAGVSNLPEFAAENPVMGDHSSQWGTLFHEGYLKAITERDWIWGTYVWVMYDFAVSTRNEGDTIGRNDKGLVRFDHTTKKDQYYLYQANWSDEPMVHIVDKSLEQTVSREVKVYSTLDELTLSINGEVVGKKLRTENDSALQGVFIWSASETESFINTEEQNTILVSGNDNGESYSDTFSRYAKEYSGTTIYSSDIAIKVTGEAPNLLGTISQLPADTTYAQLKAWVTLDTGADWGTTSVNDNDILVDGDNINVIAGNGLQRTYVVKNEKSLSTYRNLRSTMSYFINPSSVIDQFIDGDESTTPVAIVGSSTDAVYSTISIDLGSVYYVDSIEPVRNSGTSQDVITFNIKGDVLGTDKVAYTDDVNWVDQPVTLNNGAQGIRYVELEITGSQWSINWGVEYPLAGFSEINIYGGFIKSDILNIDYKNKQISLDNLIGDFDALRAAIVSIDSLGVVSDVVTVEYLDSDGQPTTDLSLLKTVVATQVRNGKAFVDSYQVN